MVGTRREGNVRVLTFGNGREVRERIVADIAVDDVALRLADSVMGGGRLAVEHHHALFQVFAADAGHTRLVWIADVLLDTLSPRPSGLAWNAGLRK